MNPDLYKKPSLLQQVGQLRLPKNPLRAILIIAILLSLSFGAYSLIKDQSFVGGGSSTSSRKVESQRIDVNQSIDIPTGLEKDGGSPLKVAITTGQLTNRILVNKKSQYSSSGTNYLMLNLLIENNNSRKINFKSRDVIRLIDVNGKKFAPRYYNKDVAVEADSARKDVLGFRVPSNMKEFKIQYGLLSGEKKILELKFK